MKCFIIRAKLVDVGWYRLAVSVDVHRWIMQQDKDIWYWDKRYNGTNYIDVDPDLLLMIKLKYTEIPADMPLIYLNSGWQKDNKEE